MVHQFKNNGYDIVLDVNSGAIHVVDDVTYDVIALFEDHSREEIIAQLQSRYPEQEIAEAIEETEQLKEQGDLFTEDAYEQKIFDFKKRPTVVKALCLHIAHDCNLACRYCFAEEGVQFSSCQAYFPRSTTTLALFGRSCAAFAYGSDFRYVRPPFALISYL